MALTEAILRKIFDEKKKKAIERYKKGKRRDAFVKKNSEKILPLSMDGWPRTKSMKDYIKWLDLVFDAKIKGIYGFGTSNCDVIAQLNRKANELSKNNKQ